MSPSGGKRKKKKIPKKMGRALHAEENSDTKASEKTHEPHREGDFTKSGATRQTNSSLFSSIGKGSHESFVTWSGSKGNELEGEIVIISQATGRWRRKLNAIWESPAGRQKVSFVVRDHRTTGGGESFKGKNRVCCGKRPIWPEPERGNYKRVRCSAAEKKSIIITRPKKKETEAGGRSGPLGQSGEEFYAVNRMGGGKWL